MSHLELHVSNTHLHPVEVVSHFAEPFSVWSVLDFDTLNGPKEREEEVDVVVVSK